MTWNSTLKPGRPLQRKTFLRSTRRHRRKPEAQYIDACRDQSCYLQVPGVCKHITADPTVVPCHGNWHDTGKGMGIKAVDSFTVPGCASCHYWLDFGPASREEKRSVFFDALARWRLVRDEEKQ